MRELMAAANHISCREEFNALCMFNRRTFFTPPVPYSPTQTVDDLRRTLNTQARLVHLGRTLMGGRAAE